MSRAATSLGTTIKAVKEVKVQWFKEVRLRWMNINVSAMNSNLFKVRMTNAWKMRVEPRTDGLTHGKALIPYEMDKFLWSSAISFFRMFN